MPPERSRPPPRRRARFSPAPPALRQGYRGRATSPSQRRVPRGFSNPPSPRSARREHGAFRTLHPAFEIYIRAVFFRIGATGQDHIRLLRTCIAMMALINHESLLQPRHLQFIRTEQIHGLNIAVFRTFEDG